jgi:hypothetical protein
VVPSRAGSTPTPPFGLSEHLSFRETVAYLKQEIAVAAESQLLDITAAFYQTQLHHHPSG